MTLFGKKKDEEDEDFNEEEEKDAPSKKSFKDLKPENRKKRKEPPKPWGKKERGLVLITLFVTVVAAIVLSLSATGFRWPKFNGFSLPKLGSSTISISGIKEQRDRAEKIKQEFAEKTSGRKGIYGFYIIELGNGFGFGAKETEIFPAASFNKLPVLAAIFIQVEAGSLDLSSTHTLTSSDKQTGAGTLAGKPAGTKISLAELVRLIGNGSDNTALYIAQNEVGGTDNIDAVTQQIGMKRTSFVDNTTTPQDIGIYFKRLYQNEIVSEKYSDQALGFLTNTVREDLIPEGVPKGVRVSHKYGTIDGVVNDAGVIFAVRPYVLVMMSKEADTTQAQQTIVEFSRAVYLEMTK